jgi:hypothetical protein
MDFYDDPKQPEKDHVDQNPPPPDDPNRETAEIAEAVNRWLDDGNPNGD